VTSGGGLGNACCWDWVTGSTSTSSGVCSGVISTGTSTSSAGSGPGTGSSVFSFIDRVVFARFDFAVFARPPAPFRLPFVVAVDAVDIVLVSMDSSRSGISMMLGASESIVVLELD